MIVSWLFVVVGCCAKTCCYEVVCAFFFIFFYDSTAATQILVCLRGRLDGSADDGTACRLLAALDGDDAFALAMGMPNFMARILGALLTVLADSQAGKSILIWGVCVAGAVLCVWLACNNDGFCIGIQINCLTSAIGRWCFWRGSWQVMKRACVTGSAVSQRVCVCVCVCGCVCARVCELTGPPAR